MALNKIACPECGAGLKSATGFQVGQAIRCPKCKEQFDVEAPADDEEEVEARKPSRKPVRAAVDDDDEDEEDERPKKKKKKKKRRDDDENAPSKTAFYIRLGVLLLILIGLAIAFAVLGPGGFAK